MFNYISFRNFILLLILFSCLLNKAQSQEYPIYIDKNTVFTWPQPLNNYFVDKANDGYITIFSQDGPKGPNPYFPTELKIKKLDSKGNPIAEKIIDKEWWSIITPDCRKIGNNYRLAIQYYGINNPNKIIYYTLLYDSSLNLLEKNEIIISDTSKCRTRSYWDIGTWKTIGDTTGHFLHLDCTNSYYRLLAFYDKNGYYLGLKDSTNIHKTNLTKIFSPPFDINKGQNFVIAENNYNVYDYHWNLIDTMHENKLKNHDSDELRSSYIETSDGFIGLDGFYPNVNVPGQSSKKADLIKFDNQFNQIEKKSIVYTPDYYPFGWYPITPRGGLYKTDDGNFTFVTSLDKGFCGCSDDTLSSYITRVKFDKDFNILCHKEFRVLKQRLRFGYITDMQDGSMLITGIINPISIPYKRTYHPFFAYIPKNSCDIPWAKEVYDLNVSINDVKLLPGKVSCFPSPAIDNITFSYDRYSSAYKLKIQIFNTNGNPVFNSDWSDKDLKVDLRHFHSGEYFYMVTSSDGSFASGKFIKL